MDTGLNTIEFYSGDISGNFLNAASPQASGGSQDNGSSSITFTGTPSGPVLLRLSFARRRGDTDANTNCHAHCYCDSHTDAYSNSHGYPNSYTECYSNCYTKGHTKAATDASA